MAEVANLDELEEALDAATGPLVVVFDIDNTLVPQGAAPEVVARGVAKTRSRFEAVANVADVIVLTNGALRGATGVIAGGNKPWTTRRRLGLSGGEAVWVVGDQVLTDGILARRLDGTFVRLVCAPGHESRPQAVLRWVGELAKPLLFRPAQSQ
jgi:predicted HAD superfamily phosphohydrolase YqeG